VPQEDGGSGNYSFIEPSVNSVNNQPISEADIPNGHGIHNGDIIPPIFNGDVQLYGGKNWDPAGQAIYDGGKCTTSSYSYANQVTLPSVKVRVDGENLTVPPAVGDVISIGPRDTKITDAERAAVDVKAAQSAQTARDTGTGEGDVQGLHGGHLHVHRVR
jgi:hypothetical protein